jgi:xanthine dehydrogenase accessory factor
MEIKEYYQILTDLVSGNEPVWQVIIVDNEGSTPSKPGMKMLIPLSGKIFGNLGGGEMEHTIINQVRTEQPQQSVFQTFLLYEQGDLARLENETPTSMICGGKVSVFIEPLHKLRRLYIIGAGHCGRALAELAGKCGYHVIMLDDRQDVLADVPNEILAERRLSDYSDISRQISFDQDALIVIMTYGHVHDQQVLEQCLRQPFRYLGMIGSTRKVQQTLANLEQKGFLPADLARIHAPIGLPIGSQTPWEIAVSIMAELISLQKDH